MYRYQYTVEGDGCFDPETVIILSAAYDEAWRSLQKSGIYFTSSREAEAARERLAQRIVKNAKGGDSGTDDEGSMETTHKGLLESSSLRTGMTRGKDTTSSGTTQTGKDRPRNRNADRLTHRTTGCQEARGTPLMFTGG